VVVKAEAKECRAHSLPSELACMQVLFFEKK